MYIKTITQSYKSENVKIKVIRHNSKWENLRDYIYIIIRGKMGRFKWSRTVITVKCENLSDHA